MPAYDFRCTTCRAVQEVVRPATDDSPVVCEVCGGDTKRVFSPVGVHFKGSGFHNTDNRKPEKAAESSAPVPAPSPACPAASAGGGCAGCPAAE